jgi:hypothetical protein
MPRRARAIKRSIPSSAVGRHVSIFGIGIAEGEIDGSGYPEYALTSMGDTKPQNLDPRRRRPRRISGLPRHRGRGRGDRAYPLCRRREAAPDRLAFRIRRLQQRRPARPLHLQGQCREDADFAAFDPDNLLLGQWNDKFAKTGAQAGITLDRQDAAR